MAWHSTQSHYTDTGPTSSVSSMLSANERAANTIFNVFGVTRPTGRSSNCTTAPVGSKVRHADLNDVYHNGASAWQNQQNDWASREESDQHGIRPVWSVFAVHSMELRFLRVDSENWSEWADAQADLSLRWVYMSFCWFFFSCGGSYMQCCR